MAAVVALVLMASMPAVARPSSAQSPAPPSLAISSFVMRGPAPHWTFGVPTNTQIDVVVTNHGGPSSGYRLVYQWSGPAGLRYLDEDELHSTDESDQRLAQSSSWSHSIQWRPQPDEAGFGDVVVSLQGLSGGAPDATPGDDQAVLPHVFVARYAASMTGDVPALTLHRGETGFARVPVTNDGNVALAASIGIPNATQGNRSRLQAVAEPSSLVVAPGTQSNVTLFVTFPADSRSDLPFAANFSLRADLDFGRNLSWQGPEIDVVGGAAPPSPRLTVTGLPTATLFVHPSSPAALALRVRNEGPGNDTYRVLVAPDPGWTAEVDDPHPALHAGESSDLTLRIGAGSVPPGAPGRVAVEIVSEHGTTSWVGTVETRVSGPAVRIASVSPLGSPWYINKPVSANLTLVNDGDAVPDATSTLVVHWVPPSGPSSSLSFHPAPLPKGAANISVSFPAPLSGGDGTLAAEWLPTGGALPDAMSVAVFVHAPQLRISGPGPASGVAGEAVRYLVQPSVFQVTNLGNAAESVAAAAASDGGEARVDGDATFTLEPGATRIVPVLHVLPDATGTHRGFNLTLRAIVVGHPDANASANVTTRLLDSAPPQLSWKRPSAGLWTLDVPMPIDLGVQDASTVRGANITLTPPGGPTRGLPTRDSKTGVWSATFLPSVAGNYTLRADAADWFQNSAKATPLVVQVRPLPLPKLTILGRPPEARITNGTELRLRLEDVTGNATILVDGGTLPDGTPFHAQLAHAGPWTNVTIPQLAPGNVTFLVTLVTDVGGKAIGTADLSFQAPSPTEVAGAEETSAPTHPTGSPGPGLVALIAAFVSALAAVSGRGRRGRARGRS